MQKKSFSLSGSDAHKIPVYGWLPPGTPTYVIHIAHGMSEYAERYAPIAEILTGKGIAVYAHDHRGHGKAVASDNELGLTGHNWFNTQVEDIDTIVQHLKKEHPRLKLFLLGHSMGSFISQRYFQLYGKELDGLILSATNGKKDPLMDIGIAVAWVQMKLFGMQYRSTLIDSLSFKKFNDAFKPVRTPHDWLSRNTDEVDKYYADPLCGFICSAAFFYYLFKGIGEAFKKENMASMRHDIPVYAFGGDRDPVGLFGKGFLKLISNWKNAGVKDITYQLYKDGRHEMLNEINRNEVVNDLVDWMKKYI